MKKIYFYLSFLLLWISEINKVYSQQSCEQLIKSSLGEEEIIKEIEANMLEIKKDSDK